MTETIRVETPEGPGELVLDAADRPVAALLLGHGAGSDIDSWDLALLASRLPGLGVSLARYRQPYRVAGRAVYSSAPGLDRGWAPALTTVRRLWQGPPLFTGGHSAGARVACRGFDAATAGLVALSFPLHQPGKPHKSRVQELVGVTAPVLVIQGTKDAFGGPVEVARALADAGYSGARIVPVPEASHSLAPVRSAPALRVAEREELVVGAVSTFIADVLNPVPSAE